MAKQKAAQPYKSVVTRPSGFIDADDAHHIKTMIEILPYRWKHQERDLLESIGKHLGDIRDHRLYLKAGCETWEQYCSEHMHERAVAMDALIRFVRVLHGEDEED